MQRRPHGAQVKLLVCLSLILLAACGPQCPEETDAGVDSGVETQPALNPCQKTCPDAGDPDVDAGIPAPVVLGVSL